MTNNLLTIFIFITTALSLLSEMPVEKRPKLFRRLKLSNMILLLAFVIAGIGIYNNIGEEIEKDKSEAQLKSFSNNLDKMADDLESEFEDVQVKINAIGDLSTKLDSLKTNTERAIRERQGSIDEYNRISRQLKEKIISENRLLVGKKPRVTVLSGDSKVITEDSTNYTFKIFLKNFGDRVAVNVKYSVLTILIPISGDVIDNFMSNYEDSKPLTLYPVAMNNSFHFVTVASFDSTQIVKSKLLVNRIHLEWYDEFTGIQDNDTLSFVTGKIMDKFQMTGNAPEEMDSLINNYIVEIGNPFNKN